MNTNNQPGKRYKTKRPEKVTLRTSITEKELLEAVAAAESMSASATLRRAFLIYARETYREIYREVYNGIKPNPTPQPQAQA